MGNEEKTTIKLSKDFVRWLKAQGVKGDSYQDIFFKIIEDLPNEKFEEYLKRSGYSYEETAKIFGFNFKEETK